MKLALRIAGGFALFSAALWAFTGIPLWASVGDDFGRGLVIGVLHVAAIFGGVFSFIE